MTWFTGQRIPTFPEATRTVDLKNCVTATYNVVEAMRKTNHDLIFPSTGAVYGDLCHDAVP
jgi:nucleoside-diphosphate-sugar epimerase